MKLSLITSLRNSRCLMRHIATLVLCSFYMVFFSPALHALVQKVENHLNYRLDNSVFKRMDTALVKAQQDLFDLQKSIESSLNLLTFKISAQEKLINLRTQFRAVDEDAMAYFDNQQALYKKHNLPLKMINHLSLCRDNYQSDMNSLNKQIKYLATINNKILLKKELQLTQQLLKRLYRAPTHHPYDQNMPFGSLDTSVRLPIQTVAQLQLLLGLPAAQMPTTEDLQETIDTPITPAIRSQAQVLGNDPVSIYNWVYNTIEFIPSYGSIQGADYILQTQKGNAVDIASLTIALLRASGIPARYHYGTVSLPLNETMNWVGGVNEVAAAQNLLAQGGIPSMLLRENGVDTAIVIEHVWVDIWNGHQWQQVDPSFKQYSYKEGMNVQNQVPFNSQSFLTTLQSGIHTNENEGWVQYSNQDSIQTEVIRYRDAIETYFNSQQSMATIGDVIGEKTIQPISNTMLPMQLPYRQVLVEQSVPVLPETLRHQFTFELSDASDNVILTYTQSTSELAGKMLTMSFSPATLADEQILTAYLPANPQTPEDLPDTIPANLFNVVGELSIDGEVVASSTALTFGQELQTSKGLWSPKSGWEKTENPMITGEYQAIGLDLHGLSSKQLTELQAHLQHTESLLDTNDLTNLTKHDVVGGILQSGIMSYLAITHIQNQISAQSNNIVYYREPSYGTFSTNARINYLFGQPQSVQMVGLLMDMDRMKSSAECKDNCWEGWRDFNQHSGIVMSAYEHLIPEQILSTPEEPVEGISAVKALSIASAQGQRIYTFDQNNMSYLSELTIDQSIKDEIATQVSSGFKATVHQHPITYSGWTGVGYTIIDPDTGAGAYKISGGSDGGYSQVSSALNPLFNILSMGFGSIDVKSLILQTDLFSILGRMVGYVGIAKTMYDAVLADCAIFDMIPMLLMSIMALMIPFALATLVISPLIIFIIGTIVGAVLSQVISLVQSRCFLNRP